MMLHNALVIIVRVYTISALFDITLPFFVFAPPNENTFRRPCMGAHNALHSSRLAVHMRFCKITASLIQDRTISISTAPQRHNKEIKFSKNEPELQRKGKKNRSRKIIWFNPPFSSNVKSNVGGGGGGQFINLIGKHFPTGHKLHKIFNKNTTKVSYSCMANMTHDSIIKSHNDRTLKKAETLNRPQEKTCNCRSQDCPLRGECLMSAVNFSDNHYIMWLWQWSANRRSTLGQHHVKISLNQ